MADLWQTISGGALHSGSWLGGLLPDAGATEAIGKVLGAGTTSQGGSDIIPNTPAQQPPVQTPPDTTTPQDKLTTVVTNTPKTTTPTTTTNNFDQIYASNYKGWDRTAAEQNWKSKGSPAMSTGGGVDDLAAQQEAAARAAAEAARLAAQKKYDAAVRQAGIAKEGAKDQYDWLIDTLGTNKQDTLTAITKNESGGLADYEEQKVKTAEQYSKAKQEILNTYRDLNAQQEKIMRGTGGMANSSRSQEAQLKLNNLLGKDLSTVTTNEADSIAAIGKAVTALKDKTIDAKNSVETSTKQQIDKSTLDYNAQIKAIDEDVNLSADEKEVAYYDAEVNLQNNIAKIQTWAAQTKIDQENQQKLLQAQLDSLILGLTDDKGGLNASLQDKLTATQKYIDVAGYTTKLDTESNLTDVTSGVKQTSKYKSKSELDAALARGEITQDDYSSMLQQIGSGTTGQNYGLSYPAGTKLNTAQVGVNNDSLLRSILGSYA